MWMHYSYINTFDFYILDIYQSLHQLQCTRFIIPMFALIKIYVNIMPELLQNWMGVLIFLKRIIFFFQHRSISHF